MTQPAPATTDKRKLALGFAAAAVLLMLVGTFTDSWFTRSKGKRTYSIGLTKTTKCKRGKCSTRALSEIKGDGLSGYKTKANLVFYVGLFSIGLLAYLAFLGSSPGNEEKMRGAGQFGLIVLGVCFTLILIHMFTKPKDLAEFEFGYSLGSHLLGTILGIFAFSNARQVANAVVAGPGDLGTRTPAPSPPQPVQAPIQESAPAPPCSGCDQPAQWVAEYERWYCYACKQYL